MNHIAAFDVLATVAQTKSSLGGTMSSEVHLLLYLACLLGLYKGRPVAEWGYSFVGTQSGAPYSHEIQRAIDEWNESRDFECITQTIHITEDGYAEYSLLRGLSQYQDRDRVIRGACDAILAFPVGVMRSSISHEPALRRVAATGQKSYLLGETDCNALYEQFAALAEVIGGEGDQDLMIPAVIWLTYLAKTSEGRMTQ